MHFSIILVNVSKYSLNSVLFKFILVAVTDVVSIGQESANGDHSKTAGKEFK